MKTMIKIATIAVCSWTLSACTQMPQNLAAFGVSHPMPTQQDRHYDRAETRQGTITAIQKFTYGNPGQVQRQGQQLAIWVNGEYELVHVDGQNFQQGQEVRVIYSHLGTRVLPLEAEQSPKKRRS